MIMYIKAYIIKKLIIKIEEKKSGIDIERNAQPIISHL